jgi:hypothetical protein
MDGRPHALTGWILVFFPKRRQALCGNNRRKPQSPARESAASPPLPWRQTKGAQRLVHGPRLSCWETRDCFKPFLAGIQLSLARALRCSSRPTKAAARWPVHPWTSGVCVSPREWRYMNCKYRHVWCRSSQFQNPLLSDLISAVWPARLPAAGVWPAVG